MKVPIEIHLRVSQLGAVDVHPVLGEGPWLPWLRSNLVEGEHASRSRPAQKRSARMIVVVTAVPEGLCWPRGRAIRRRPIMPFASADHDAESYGRGLVAACRSSSSAPSPVSARHLEGPWPPGSSVPSTILFRPLAYFFDIVVCTYVNLSYCYRHPRASGKPALNPEILQHYYRLCAVSIYDI